ncbi:hypothetical protein AH448_15955 [Salmonella enterica subsp. diarizonae]|uniref:Uncharacterized protein n=6 Tax=Salmonella enterica TaxID=28901 RepID=A0A3R0B525_SALDZ|nr:hypothetical protein DOE63_03540 [Salmonella enterica subsp. diarizonae serovar 59:z10:-]AXC74969.1 hypothetical protein DOE59_15665 [Salmonella enterica subsp. diarizonae serovar 48:i:z]AXD12100.1 hypothetical protein CHE29_15095 [Salmonella enterica]EAA0679355.1 hypothetical protein [Salmonella enterica subsp. diarizonae]EAA7932186.1 hypothetical protein [Salmonella enterica subsp. enterica serovar Redlands]EAS9235245.1 hypothetical protein [Salmonella enterica subsp. enterica]EBE3718711
MRFTYNQQSRVGGQNLLQRQARIL